MSTRRPRGTGGMTQIDQGTWRVDVEMARAPGEPRRRLSRTFRGTRWVAENALADLRGGGPPEGERLAFAFPQAWPRRFGGELSPKESRWRKRSVEQWRHGWRPDRDSRSFGTCPAA